MLKKIIILFKLGRKVAKSDILDITSKFQQPPLSVKILFKILSFSFSPKKTIDKARQFLLQKRHSALVHGAFDYQI